MSTLTPLDSMTSINYGSAIRSAFEYLLTSNPNVFIIGQGLWSPWYVGNSMTDLDKKFGVHRVIDTPVSECAVTGAAVGASLSGMRPVVVHPRMDFMLYAIDPIVNQAAKWNYMFGGQQSAAVTIRGIVNRGGEQGAQHSQALHSWFCHIPGLKVVMPYTVSDARDLLIASVLSDDPVVFIDDRWLYDNEDIIPPPSNISLTDIKPQFLSKGSDVTVISSGYSSHVCVQALELLSKEGFTADHIDLRVLSSPNLSEVFQSIARTGRLLVVDHSWAPCGLSSEIISQCLESVPLSAFSANPSRITLPFCPAPTSSLMEDEYYFTPKMVFGAIMDLINGQHSSAN